MFIQGNIVDIPNQRIFKGELEITNDKITAIREAEGTTFIINEENIGVLAEYLKSYGHTNNRL